MAKNEEKPGSTCLIVPISPWHYSQNLKPRFRLPEPTILGHNFFFKIYPELIPDPSLIILLNVFRLVGAIMGTPADVVKARMMNQPTNQNGRGLLYKNSFDCLMQTIKHEGFPGLYKGFVPCWFRMAPWSLTFWLSFEQIRRGFGAKSWGT